MMVLSEKFVDDGKYKIEDKIIVKYFLMNESLNEKVLNTFFNEVKYFSISNNNKILDSGLINILENIQKRRKNFEQIILTFFLKTEKTINEITIKPKNFESDIFKACK